VYSVWILKHTTTNTTTHTGEYIMTYFLYLRSLIRAVPNKIETESCVSKYTMDHVIDALYNMDSKEIAGLTKHYDEK